MTNKTVREKSVPDSGFWIQTDSLRKCQYFFRFLNHNLHWDIADSDIPEMTPQEFCWFLNAKLSAHLGNLPRDSHPLRDDLIDQVERRMPEAYNEYIIAEEHFSWLKNERACFWFWTMLRCCALDLDDQRHIVPTLLPFSQEKLSITFPPRSPFRRLHEGSEDSICTGHDRRSQPEEAIIKFPESRPRKEYDGEPEQKRPVYCMMGLNEYPRSSQERYALIMRFFDLWRTPRAFISETLPHPPLDPTCNVVQSPEGIDLQKKKRQSHLDAFGKEPERQQDLEINQYPLVPRTSKLMFLQKMQEHWYNQLARDDGLKWLDPKDEIQCSWAWDYLLSQKQEDPEALPYIGLFDPLDCHEKYLAIGAVLDSWYKSSFLLPDFWYIALEDKIPFMQRMRKAWNQRKFRDDQKKEDGMKKLKKSTLKKLDEIAKKRNKKSMEVLEELIKDAHGQLDVHSGKNSSSL